MFRRKRDQERQRELARQRLEARRNRTKSDLDKEKLKLLDVEQTEETVTDPTNIAALQVQIKTHCSVPFLSFVFQYL